MSDERMMREGIAKAGEGENAKAERREPRRRGELGDGGTALVECVWSDKAADKSGVKDGAVPCRPVFRRKHARPLYAFVRQGIIDAGGDLR
jgi:hypothetical protein